MRRGLGVGVSKHGFRCGTPTPDPSPQGGGEKIVKTVVSFFQKKYSNLQKYSLTRPKLSV